MKKLFAILLTLAMLCGFTTVLSAEGPEVGLIDLGGALVMDMGNQAMLDDFFKWDGIPSGCINSVVDGALKISLSASNAIVEITGNATYEMSKYTTYAVRYKIDKDTMVNPRFVFYIYNATNGNDASAWTSVSAIADGEWHVAAAPQYMWGEGKTLSGNTTTVRFDLSCDSYTDGAAAYVDSISVGVNEKAAKGGCLTFANADECTNDVVAIKMGSETIIKDYFNRDGNGGSATVEDGVMKWTLDGSTYWCIMDLSDNIPLALDKYPYMAVRYKTSDVDAPKFIYYAHNAAGAAKDYMTAAGTANGEWQVAVFPNACDWNDINDCLRFDVVTSNEDKSGTVLVDYIIFATSEAAANKYMNPTPPTDPDVQDPDVQDPDNQDPVNPAPDTRDSAVVLAVLAIVALGSGIVASKKRH